MHTDLWIAFLAVIALVNLAMTLRCFHYIRREYPRKWLPLLGKGYSPKVSLLVPCKGLEDRLETYLESMATQQYPDYIVTFITESGDDPATGAITKIKERHPHARHVIAGSTSTSCQKNHNLLAGLATESDSEVLVFADADVGASPTWLRELVEPLGIEGITATTGFRWLEPETFSVAATCHAMLSGYIMILLPDGKGMWGGSMAIRRVEFEEMAVAERWRTAVVDDISLSQLLFRHGKRRLFVPSCICMSSGALRTVRELAAWFTRQVMYLKIYLKPLWLIAVALHVFFFLALWSSLAFIAQHLLTGGADAEAMAGAAFLIVMMANTWALKHLYPGRQSGLAWSLLTVPAQFIGVVSLVASGLTNVMVWRDLRYRVNGNGDVTSIERVQ